MSLTIWPDHNIVLSNALDLCALQPFHAATEEIYELIIEDPEFYPSITNIALGDEPLWMTLCRSTRCLDIILSHQGLEFFDLSPGARLDRTLALQLLEPAGFLKFIGPQCANNLACLKGVDGESVLHHVASCLHRNEETYRAWLQLGVDLLRNGADPHAVSSRWTFQDGIGRTPLIHLLLCDPYWNSSPVRLLHIVRDWANMIRQAGLDLLDYGARESEVWKSLGVGSHLLKLNGWIGKLLSGSSGIYIKRLIFGSNPQDWSLEFARSVIFSLRRLRPLPGAYPSQARIPDSILWEPSEEEQYLGSWDVISTRTLLSPNVDLRDIGLRSEGPLPCLFNSTQDDSGVIALMQYRTGRPQARDLRPRSRAQSQPSFLRRREVAYCAVQRVARAWLGDIHLCPFDMRWKLGPRSYEFEILSDNYSWAVADLRKCMQGWCWGHNSVQQSSFWRRGSFLGDVRLCQDTRELREQCYLEGHTGTAECPWGCSKVHLDRLRVPESLQEGHPQREFPDGYGDD